MKQYKKDFPIFEGRDLVYCDSAATTHKPQVVIDRVADFYAHHNAPVHRGIYALAEEATEMYEHVRSLLAAYLGAEDANEIVFTHGTTESINTVAFGWGRANLKPGDEIVISEQEHHANLVPWQLLSKEKKLILRFIPMLSDGTIDYAAIPKMLSEKTKLLAITAGSNVIGVATDLEKVMPHARKVGARVLIDAAQMAPRMRYNVQELGCDFLVLSGHKMLGPTGVGALYVKKDLHDSFEPMIVGGSMVLSVDLKESRWRPMPNKLEAGTPAIAQVIGLGAALEYLMDEVDFAWLEKHEAMLSRRLIEGLERYEDVRILGPVEQMKTHGHLVSFSIKGFHAHDVAAYLDTFGIAVRAGHHCAQPLHTKLDVPNSVRASFYLYNTEDDIVRLLEAMDNLFRDLKGEA